MVSACSANLINLFQTLHLTNDFQTWNKSTENVWNHKCSYQNSFHLDGIYSKSTMLEIFEHWSVWHLVGDWKFDLYKLKRRTVCTHTEKLRENQRRVVRNVEKPAAAADFRIAPGVFGHWRIDAPTSYGLFELLDRAHKSIHSLHSRR